MMKSSLCLVVFILSFINCNSQNSNNYSCDSKGNLFSDGICLEKVGIIPWYINYNKIGSYSYSRIDSSLKRGGISVYWDSASVFDNLPVDLFIHTNIKSLHVDKIVKVSEFVMDIDTSFIPVVVDYFEKYTKCNNCYLKTKTFYSWKIDECVVRMVFKTRRKDTFQIHIQKIVAK